LYEADQAIIEAFHELQYSQPELFAINA
jgi:hypothetical protein